MKRSKRQSTLFAPPSRSPHARTKLNGISPKPVKLFGSRAAIVKPDTTVKYFDFYPSSILGDSTALKAKKSSKLCPSPSHHHKEPTLARRSHDKSASQISSRYTQQRRTRDDQMSIIDTPSQSATPKKNGGSKSYAPPTYIPSTYVSSASNQQQSNVSSRHQGRNKTAQMNDFIAPKDRCKGYQAYQDTTPAQMHRQDNLFEQSFGHQDNQPRSFIEQESAQSAAYITPRAYVDDGRQIDSLNLRKEASANTLQSRFQRKDDSDHKRLSRDKVVSNRLYPHTIDHDNEQSDSAYLLGRERSRESIGLDRRSQQNFQVHDRSSETIPSAFDTISYPSRYEPAVYTPSQKYKHTDQGRTNANMMNDLSRSTITATSSFQPPSYYNTKTKNQNSRASLMDTTTKASYQDAPKNLMRDHSASTIKSYQQMPQKHLMSAQSKLPQQTTSPSASYLIGNKATSYSKKHESYTPSKKSVTFNSYCNNSYRNNNLLTNSSAHTIPTKRYFNNVGKSTDMMSSQYSRDQNVRQDKSPCQVITNRLFPHELQASKESLSPLRRLPTTMSENTGVFQTKAILPGSKYCQKTSISKKNQRNQQQYVINLQRRN